MAMRLLRSQDAVAPRDSRLLRLASTVAALRGWRRWLLVALLGTGAGFAMPPWHVFPLMVVGLVGLVWLIDGTASAAESGPRRPHRQSFLDGLLWGLGYFTVGSLWIIEAFSVPPADFVALGPPIVGGLAVVLAIFVGLACLAWTGIVRRVPALGRGWARVLLFAALAAVFEWLRGHVFTGYPWNPFGHVWAFAVVLLQPASWIGVYGLSAITVALLALPAALSDGRHRATAILAVLLLLPFAAAAPRLLLATPEPGGPMLRLVQPNIPQGEKWLAARRGEHMARLLQLSLAQRPEAVRHVIWPETAVPFLLNESPDYLRAIAAVVPDGGYLLVGAPRGAMTPAEAAIVSPGNQEPAWNSLHAVDATGAIRATYDKVHLVPLGEYLPLRRYFPILADTIGRGSFEAGTQRRTIRLPGLPPVGVIICYEAIFPAAVVDPVDRPAWILNVTNDSWFGASSGPYQHFVSARLRAIEEGLPLVRVANTGISAVVDRFGRVEAQLGMEKTGVIDHNLPPAGPATPFARFGDWAFAATLLLMALPLAWSASRN
ncbi:apolipoprotein N-acyltransferase [Vineibacter terrae]|uniref:Apolipoprotein N-acyltransferase n=1 Tax=Vineibacter terrae TaxID=2586908 RepID=A0A5C8PER3_9HYPH|nr:apolipoprotein N-acyltransferase [Vineibacter terrae]TXL72281.1 apolipoprotein N-acyltransferase [Vineibacter terrae]